MGMEKGQTRGCMTTPKIRLAALLPKEIESRAKQKPFIQY